MLWSAKRWLPVISTVFLFFTGKATALWGPPQNIIPSANAYGGSWTAANGAQGLAAARDTVFLVWTDGIKVLANTGNQVLFKYYSGAAWGGDTVIGYLGNWRLHNWFPSCVRDGAGRLHIVWESGEYESDGGYDLAYTSVRQGVWSGQQHLVSSPSNTWHPVIAATADGKVHVCWQDDRNGGFRLYYKAWDGAGWSGEVALPGFQVYASFPSMASFGTTAAVAWQDFRTGIFQIHCQELAAQAWGSDSAVSHSAQGAYTPCLVSDAGGNYHLAWEDWRDGNAEIFYRRYDRGAGSWGAETRITSDPWRSRAPVLACRGDSLVDVFWEDDRSGYFQIMNRQALRGSWSAETTLTAGGADNRCPAVCADERGNLCLVWSGFGVNPPPARPDLFSMSNITNPWPKSDPAGSTAQSVPRQDEVKAFPNPAAGRTTVTFMNNNGSGENCTAGIYTITGQLLRTIAARPAAGNIRTATWDGTDGHGRQVASGIYLIMVRQGRLSRTVKLSLVR